MIEQERKEQNLRWDNIFQNISELEMKIEKMNEEILSLQSTVRYFTEYNQKMFAQLNLITDAIL